MKILKIFVLIFFSIIVSLLLFVFLELFSSLFVEQKNDRLQDIIRLLEQDSVLFWKQKANLDTVFQNQKVLTNSIGFRNPEIKQKQKTRIICLGASPTFGYGVKYEDTYPFVVEQNLKLKGFDTEVINAGEIGYSSYQGLNLLKNKIINLKPDIITISYVINDIDKYRFFRSNYLPDKELKPLSKFVVVISNFVYNSNLFKLINQLSRAKLSKRQQYYGKNYNSQYSENRRVSLQDYENNLKEFIDFAKNNNIKIFFIVMPVNLPTKKFLNEQELSEINNLISEVEKNLKEKKYIECKDILQKILLIDSFSAKCYYYLGVLAEEENNIKLANEYFEKAKNFEIFDCAAISLEYNKIMREVSLNNNIAFCDCAKEFKKYNGDYLFVDPKYDCFHPNAKGHNIIAEMLTEKIINYFEGAEYGTR